MDEELVGLIAEQAGIKRAAAKRLLSALESFGRWRIVCQSESQYGVRSRPNQVKWVQSRTGLDAAGAEHLVDLIERNGYQIRSRTPNRGRVVRSKSVHTVSGGASKSNRRGH
jgi:DNA-binding MarR family transcriptional regulator